MQNLFFYPSIHLEVNINVFLRTDKAFVEPKLSDFWGRDVPRSCATRFRGNRRHTHGYVEDFPEALWCKRLVQIESKIAQFRLTLHHKNKSEIRISKFETSTNAQMIKFSKPFPELQFYVEMVDILSFNHSIFLRQQTGLFRISNVVLWI
jgi:hypothetical protein